MTTWKYQFLTNPEGEKGNFVFQDPEDERATVLEWVLTVRGLRVKYLDYLFFCPVIESNTMGNFLAEVLSQGIGPSTGIPKSITYYYDPLPTPEYIEEVDLSTEFGRAF